jgi:hypothetical protein
MAAVLLALTPILGCTALGPLVGKPDKVVIHHFGDLSGPYARITAPIVNGFNDFAEWFNTEGGGIDGVPIVQEFIDTGGAPEVSLEAYEEFKASKPYPIINIVYGPSECETLGKLYTRDRILCFTNSPTDECIYPPGYMFSAIPSYADSIGAFIDWVIGDWAKKTGEEVKLAILTWDSDFGMAIMTYEVRQYAASKGVDIVYEDVFEVGDVNVSAQMEAIKSAGANWVYDNTLAHGPEVIHKSAASLGILNQDIYDNTPGMIHRATGPWGMDESVVALAGELTEGMVGPRSFPSWSMSEVEGVAAAITAFHTNNRKLEEMVMGYLATWPELYTVCYCMNQAVEEVGWDELSGVTLRDQFLKLEDFSPQEMTKYTFTADKPEPSQTRIFEVYSGRLLPITDWVTCPDLRPTSFK